MAYSADLRNKALNYYEQCKNISQTAATFNLSRNTLYLWIRLKKQTGSLKHQVTGLNAVKLDRQKLAQYVGQHQDAYLHEIAKHFDCTPAAVCILLFSNLFSPYGADERFKIIVCNNNLLRTNLMRIIMQRTMQYIQTARIGSPFRAFKL